MNNGDTVAKKNFTASFKSKKRTSSFLNDPQRKFGMKGKRMY
jgi:hypothetical protein